jgi:hypothetical protein
LSGDVSHLDGLMEAGSRTTNVQRFYCTTNLL